MTVCWHDRGDIRCRAHDCGVVYGRYRSGRRWFWMASRMYGADLYGWADNKQAAMEAAHDAVERLADGQDAWACFRAGAASDKLKQLNAAKRMKRWSDAPTNGSDTHTVKYLYDEWGHVFRITKKTAKRIYYVKKEAAHGYPEQIGMTARHRVADDWPGPTWCELSDLQDRMGYRNAPKFFLKPRPPGFSNQPPAKKDLRHLKAAMAAAHPDKGGSAAAFITARKVYLEALRQRRS